jgi:hypothetical protein
MAVPSLVDHAIPSAYPRETRTRLMLFVAIASETDHLPVGEVRKQYSPDALRKADAEIAEAEKLYRAQAKVVCEKLIARFSNAT